MKTLIIQQGSGKECVDMLKVTAAHHRAYASWHGMDLWTMTGPTQMSGGVNWDKMVLIMQAVALNLYDLIVWMDADTLIADLNTDLRGAAEEFEHIGLCRHEWGWEEWKHLGFHLNAGVIFVRPTNVARKALEDIWDERTRVVSDQRGVMSVFTRDPTPFQVIDNRWNSLAVSRHPHPVVLAWHGDAGNRPGEMARKLASLSRSIGG